MSERVQLFPSVDRESLINRLKELRAELPRMGALVLLPEAESQKLSDLQAAFKSTGVPLVGAIFPQIVTDEGFSSQGLVLVILDPMPSYLLQGELEGSGEQLEQKTEQMAESLLGRIKSCSDPTLFMFFDAMVPRIATVLEGLYLKLADRVRYVGLNAGSETFKPIPCLFDSERIIQGGVLALVLDKAPQVILEHGYRPPEQMVAATSTEGNRIISIDWRPAFEVYREQVKKHYGEEINRENFYRLAVHFPFGIVRVDGEVLVRIPVALEEDGSLFCVGEVPANSILTLLESPKPESMDTAKKLATRLDGKVEEELLLFYCAGRRIHLGDAAIQEVRALRQLTGATHTLGALSLGEIGSSRRGGYPLFHNAAVVCTTA